MSSAKFYTYTSDGRTYYGNQSRRGDTTVQALIELDTSKYGIMDYEQNSKSLVLFDKVTANRTPAQLRDAVKEAIIILKNAAKRHGLELAIRSMVIRHMINGFGYRVTPKTILKNKPPQIPEKLYFNYERYTDNVIRDLLDSGNDILYSVVQSPSVGCFAISFSLSEIRKTGNVGPVIEDDTDPEPVSWDKFGRAAIYLKNMLGDFNAALSVRIDRDNPEEIKERFYVLVDNGLRSLARVIKIAENERLPFPLKHNSNYHTLNFYWYKHGEDMLDALADGDYDPQYAGIVQNFVRSGEVLLAEMDYIRKNPDDVSAWKSFKAGDIDDELSAEQKLVVLDDLNRYAQTWYKQIKRLESDGLNDKEYAKGLRTAATLLADNMATTTYARYDYSSPFDIIDEISEKLNDELSANMDKLQEVIDDFLSGSFMPFDKVTQARVNVSACLNKILGEADKFSKNLTK